MITPRRRVDIITRGTITFVITRAVITRIEGGGGVLSHELRRGGTITFVITRAVITRIEGGTITRIERGTITQTEGGTITQIEGGYYPD